MNFLSPASPLASNTEWRAPKVARFIPLLGVLMLVAASHTAHAAIINEIAVPNDNRAGAQLLSAGSFTPNTDPNVSTPSPTVTVLGALTTGDAGDIYSFFGQGGSTAVFDIDNNPYTFDTIVALFDSSGTRLAFNDDSALDPGSADDFDSFFTFTLPSSQLYYTSVTRCCGVPVTADTIQNTGSASGGNYRLNISVQPVPEPSTYAMMFLGVGALGFVMRRKRDGAVDNSN